MVFRKQVQAFQMHILLIILQRILKALCTNESGKGIYTYIIQCILFHSIEKFSNRCSNLPPCSLTTLFLRTYEGNRVECFMIRQCFVSSISDTGTTKARASPVKMNW